MEDLYKKLYSKYSKLKKEKYSDLEKLNHDQELKFTEYVQAAEEMIDYSRNENDRLRDQVSELRNEMAALNRSTTEQYIQYQELLMKENEKSRKLSDEINRLRNIQQEGLCCRGTDEKVGSEQLNVSASTEFRDVSANICQPSCCIRKLSSSDGNPDTSLFNCVFQDLFERVVGMKLSIVSQNEDLRVSALHQSSGYSFSLTWINNTSGKAELLYQVISLGTFERVAPEWMREAMIFSSNMCPIFFERVSRFIKNKG